MQTPQLPTRTLTVGLLALIVGMALGILICLFFGAFKLNFEEAREYFVGGFGIGVGIVLSVSIISFLTNSIDKIRSNL